MLEKNFLKTAVFCKEVANIGMLYCNHSKGETPKHMKIKLKGEINHDSIHGVCRHMVHERPGLGMALRLTIHNQV